MRALQKYDFRLDPGETKEIFAEGSYLRIISTTGPVTVKGNTFGELEDLETGQGLQQTDFTRLELKNKGAVQISGYILTSDGTFVDNRMYGAVEVTNLQSPQRFNTDVNYGGYIRAECGPLSVIPNGFCKICADSNGAIIPVVDAASPMGEFAWDFVDGYFALHVIRTSNSLGDFLENDLFKKIDIKNTSDTRSVFVSLLLNPGNHPGGFLFIHEIKPGESWSNVSGNYRIMDDIYLSTNNTSGTEVGSGFDLANVTFYRTNY